MKKENQNGILLIKNREYHNFLGMFLDLDTMTTLIYFHIATIVPVLLIGPFILFRKKGDKIHILIGRIWAVLMIVSCLTSFGIRHNGSFSWLHGLAAWTTFCMFAGIYHVRKQNIVKHKRYMIGSYIGVVIAFIFALRPERLLGSWLFG